MVKNDLIILFKATLKMFKIWWPVIVSIAALLIYSWICSRQARKEGEERGVSVNTYQEKKSA